MIQGDIYIENEKSRKLLEDNRLKLEDEALKSSLRINRLKSHINHISGMGVKEVIQRVADRKRVKLLNTTEGNLKFDNFVNEGNINISKNAKIAVYTCIVGKYDVLREPRYYNPNIDYFVFSDQVFDFTTGLEWIDIRSYPEYGEYDSKKMNRAIKILCHKYLSHYDYSLYIDGNIEIVGDVMPIICDMENAMIGIHTHAERDCVYCEGEGVGIARKAKVKDIMEQMQKYRADGFPEHFGLFQNSIIIRNHIRACYLMEAWWDEFSKLNTRDQLALPYVIWKNNVSKDEIKIIGRNSEQNPRFYTYGHS